MFKKLCVALMLLIGATPASAQLNLTYTNFQPGQTISSAQFTANFTAISANALNRTGGTMTGTLTARDIAFSAHNTYDIGSTGTRVKDIWAQGNLAVAGTATIGAIDVTTFTCTGCVDATQLAVSGVSPATYGSANTVPVFTVDVDGRITAVTNTSIAIAETQISDGSVYPRIAGTETISGTWNFSSALTVANNVFVSSATDLPSLTLSSPGQVANEKRWLAIAIDGNFHLRAYDDSSATSNPAIVVTRTGTTIDSMQLYGTLSTQTIVPFVDSTYNLGSSSVRWATVYVDNIDIASSLAATSYRISGDTDTGLNQPFGADSLSIEVGGVTALYATETAGVLGELTIGDPSSLYAFQVSTTGAVQPTSISAGTLNLGAAGRRWGTVYSTNADNISSDARLKENIIELPKGLEDLKRIGVYQYNLKMNPSKVHYGVIAQQLQEAGFGHLVSGSESEGYGVAYDELIPVLIKSIQELEQRVAELEK